MSIQQLLVVLTAAAAFLTALAHALADATGLMDKIRKYPIQPPSSPAGPPAPGPQGAAAGPPAGS